MKKVMILVAALLLIAPISAMAGMTAFMDMDEMSNAELADTTGQTGITINQTLQLAGGYIAWGDNDGCTGATAEGWLTLNNITSSAIELVGMTIDVCTESANTTWLTIGIPTQTISAGIEDIIVGNVAAGTGSDSLGELVIHSLTMQAVTIEITGH